jgi:hypothetical protein
VDSSASNFSRESFRERMAARPRTITDEPPAPGTPGAPEPIPMPGMEPWATTRVGFAMPFASMFVEAPFSIAAKFFKDDVFLLDEEQKRLMYEPTEELLKWLVWKFGLSGSVGHPLAAFALAMGGLSAAKYGQHQYNEALKSRGQRSNSQTMNDSDRGSSAPQGVARTIRDQSPVVTMRRPSTAPRNPDVQNRASASPANQPATRQGSQTVNGRMEEFGDESLYAGSRVAESPSSLTSAFVVADE